MKDYKEAITFMENMRDYNREDTKQRQYYEDAIEAMKRSNPVKPQTKTVEISCPVCGKSFYRRNAQELYHGERICNNCGQFLKW